MEKSDGAITRQFLDQEIATAEDDAKAQRKRLADAQNQANVADERLTVLRLARKILFGNDRGTCCP